MSADQSSSTAAEPTLWWEEFDPPLSPSRYGRPEDLRSEHWSYFESDVLPFLNRMLRASFPLDIADALRDRFAHRARFRPSEVLLAILSDLDVKAESPAGWAVAAVELAQFSRLVADDVVDGHNFRWGKPTISSSFGPDRALLVASVLANLATTCGGEVERRVNRTRARRTVRSPRVDLSGQVNEHCRLMSAGMQLELTLTKASAVSDREYRELAEAKACNGSLCAVLASEISGELSPADHRGLQQALRDSDLAAVVANDISEAHLRRGIETIRYVSGEERGPRTEIQLGRPTIFSVYFKSDDFVRSVDAQSLSMTQEHMWRLDPDEAFDSLQDIGALDFARSYRNSAIESALSQAPSDLPTVRTWLSHAAAMNLPKGHFLLP